MARSLRAQTFPVPQLPYNEGSVPPYDGDQLSYANDFQLVVRDIVLNLPTAQQPGSGVYSSACFKARSCARPRPVPRPPLSHSKCLFFAPETRSYV